MITSGGPYSNIKETIEIKCSVPVCIPFIVSSLDIWKLLPFRHLREWKIDVSAKPDNFHVEESVGTDVSSIPDRSSVVMKKSWNLKQNCQRKAEQWGSLQKVRNICRW